MRVWYYISCAAIIVMITSIFQVYAAEVLLTPLQPLQSSNSVLFNDCNLRMTNPQLLEKIHGQNPEKSLSANDIITAYNWTVGHPDCGGKAAIIAEPRSSSFIQNLCDVALAKLHGEAEKDGLTSFKLAKDLYKTFAEDATNPEGTMSGIVQGELFKALGTVKTLTPFTTPTKCGVVAMSEGEGLATIYLQMSQAIYNIATDCGSSIAYTPRWMQTRAGMLTSPSQTSYVFGVQQGGSVINREVQLCQQRLMTSYQALISIAQNVSIRGTSNFNVRVAQNWFQSIQDQESKISLDFAQMSALVEDTAKQTPTTAVCEVKA